MVQRLTNARGQTFYKGYDVAQICENGHPINWRADTRPSDNQNHCTQCGRATVTTCRHCNQQIRGTLHRFVSTGPSRAVEPDRIPSFCHDCGRAYSWTEKQLEAARELISEAEKLSPEEKELLSKSLDDIVCDTPNNEVAVIRFKKYLPKVGKEIAEALRSIVVDIASEATKKLFWP